MAVATYTSDLTDIFLFESTTGVSAYGGGAAGLGAGSDFAVEGVNAVDKQITASEKGFFFTAAADFTIGANDHFYIWLTLGTFGLADTRNNRGIVVVIGDDVNNFVKFHVNGADTLPFGGMVPYAIRFVNTSLTNLRTLVGTPDTAPIIIGGGANVTGTAKGANFGADAARIGTGYDVEFGTGVDPEANFAGIASNDESTAEGVLRATGGGYILQGKIRIGNATNPCEFLDSNLLIAIENTIHSLTDFSEIVIDNAASIINLTNITFLALGTNSPGRFRVLNASTVVNLTGCIFNGFGITNLQPACTFTSCLWTNNSAIITANGATMTNSTIEGYAGTADTSALVWDVNTNPNGKFDGMTFTKGSSSAHAIEFGTTSPLTMTLTDVTFSGYNAANGATDSAIYIKRTTGTVTINITGGTTPSYKSDGATVDIVANPVTVKVTTKDINGDPVGSANVFLKAASGGSGILPVSAAVTSITRVNATTAEATHAAVHNMSTGDKVYIQGADQAAYNGVFTITLVGVTDPTTMYRYTPLSDPGVNATGTLTATFVFLKDPTNAVTGILSMSRVITADQNVTGWARKHSTPPSYTPPNYKTSNITGTVLSTQNFDTTVLLISDD